MRNFDTESRYCLHVPTYVRNRRLYVHFSIQMQTTRIIFIEDVRQWPWFHWMNIHLFLRIYIFYIQNMMSDWICCCCCVLCEGSVRVICNLIEHVNIHAYVIVIYESIWHVIMSWMTSSIELMRKCTAFDVELFDEFTIDANGPHLLVMWKWGAIIHWSMRLISWYTRGRNTTYATWNWTFVCCSKYAVSDDTHKKTHIGCSTKFLLWLSCCINEKIKPLLPLYTTSKNTHYNAKETNEIDTGISTTNNCCVNINENIFLEECWKLVMPH